jgi:hypothetical protein
VRGVAASGVVVALLGLSPLPGSIVAIALLGANWFLERSIFRFTAMHITPMPDFEYDAAQWTSMAYLFEGPPPSGTPLAIGFVFRDSTYATKFFELLRAWNFGEPEDRADNIGLSFIIDERHYWVYLYPNIDRQPVRDSWRGLRGRAGRAGKNQEPFLLVLSMVICHDFRITSGYHLGYIIDRYKDGQPIQLLPLIERPGQTPGQLQNAQPITKYRLRIKARADLAPDEFEATYLARIGR